MKKMRNILTLVIAFSLVFASCRYVNAADKEEGNDTVLSKLENVPFYVTVTDEMEESSVKDTIASVIRSHKNQKSILDYQDEHCIIREIPKCRHQDMLNNVLYGGQIRRAAAMVDQGIEVEYINFFVNNETIAQSLVNSYPRLYNKIVCVHENL